MRYRRFDLGYGSGYEVKGSEFTRKGCRSMRKRFLRSCGAKNGLCSPLQYEERNKGRSLDRSQ